MLSVATVCEKAGILSDVGEDVGGTRDQPCVRMEGVFVFYVLVGCLDCVFFFFQAEDGIRDTSVTGVQTCALPIYRQRIVHIADSLNLALVTGSDNHGWGRAAPGWTLMRIPGWRGMSTDSLSRRIEDRKSVV